MIIARPSDAIVLPGIILLVLAVILESLKLPEISHVILLASFVATICGAALRKTTRFSIEESRFVMKSGILNNVMIDIPIHKVDSIEIHQSPFERIIGCGSLVVHSGQGGVKAWMLAEVQSVRTQITEMLDAYSPEMRVKNPTNNENAE